MTFDLSELRGVFFEEAHEHLGTMETALLLLEQQPGDRELLNQIFRVAHSIKGGSGTFAFGELLHFTHALEGLLSLLRDGVMECDGRVTDLLLRSNDALRALVVATERGEPMPLGIDVLLSELEAARDQAKAASAEAEAAGASRAPAAPAAAHAAEAVAPPMPSFVVSAPSTVHERRMQISFEAGAGLFKQGMDPLLVVRDLVELGRPIDVVLDTANIPALSALDAETCHLRWRVTLATERSDAELRDVFAFVEDTSRVTLECLDRVPAAAPTAALPLAAPPPPPAAGPPVQREAFAPPAIEGGLPVVVAPLPVPAAGGASHERLEAGRAHGQPTAPPATSVAPQREVIRTVMPRGLTMMPGTTMMPGATMMPGRGGADRSTVRVDIAKIDRLIDLVGELIIAQSMVNSALQESGSAATSERLRDAVVAMDRNTRELQERVMAVRMLPIGTVFNRFPRMVRDLSASLGKRATLTLVGEDIELDKGMVEKLADPLTHLVRNAIDHGLEPAEDRLAAGKPEEGSVTIHASHQGGNVVIEVTDDGRGLPLDLIREKARKLGLLPADVEPTVEQLHDVIFAPGFSTKQVVTDVSGRGVGMDVVKRNVEELGGSLVFTSEPGLGSRMRIRLPLTMAIIDGLTLRVGTQVFVVPLSSVLESLRPTGAQVQTVLGRGEILRVRDEALPLLRMHELLGVEGAETDPRKSLVCIAEARGSRVGLMVDDVLGQAQVVVKTLESNYRQVDGVMGATILGDGRVALILDVPAIARRATGPTPSSTSGNEKESAHGAAEHAA